MEDTDDVHDDREARASRADRGNGLNGVDGGNGVSRAERAGPRAAVAIAALSTAALVLSACGSSGAGTGQTSTTGQSTGSPSASPAGQGNSSRAGSVPASPSAGCGSHTSGTPGTTTITPVVDGRTRTAIVHVPTGYRPRSPVPLVVNMHGSQSTAQQQAAFSGMDSTADADMFIVVYPQGAIPAGAGFEWNVPGQPLFGGAPVPATAPDDVSFIRQLVAALGSTYCIDSKRVYATGFSGGARMASQLGCDASTVFAAIAPVSGLRFPSPCASSRPVPVLSFHGTADPVDPYDGNGQTYWTYSVPTAAQRWAAHNRCGPVPVTSHPASGVVLTSYGGCSGGTSVQLYTIDGEGHEWPGGPSLPPSLTAALGPQSSAVDANATMWSFFMAHPL